MLCCSCKKHCQQVQCTCDGNLSGKIDIPPFPLDDEERLAELAQGFRDKSCGQLFGNVIGAFDGYLLRVSKKCLSEEVNSKKYFAGE